MTDELSPEEITEGDTIEEEYDRYPYAEGFDADLERLLQDSGDV